jgi:hypothetical protein
MNEQLLPAKHVERLFHDLAFRFETVAELDLHLASHFNVFRSFSPDEPTLSDIIRDLLDPEGTHGQGDRFLIAFLQEIGLSPLRLRWGSRPRCEELTAYADRPQRRIDIFLPLEGFTIGIENKPRARDQPGFVKDYSDHLRRRSGAEFLLIFLTKQGRELESKEDKDTAASLGKNRFLTISYGGQFKSWLVACLRDCQVEKVRAFLRDFIDYVPVLEGSGMVSKEDVALVVNYVRKSPTDNLRVAYTVRQSWSEVVHDIVANFLGSLEDRLRQQLGDEWEILTVESEELLVRYKKVLSVSKRTWNRRHGISLEFERSECAGLTFGLYKEHDAGALPTPDLYDAMVKETGAPCHLENSPHWEWWVPVDRVYQDWNVPEALERLACSPEALNYFANWFLRMKKIAEPLIDSAIIEHGQLLKPKG